MGENRVIGLYMRGKGKGVGGGSCGNQINGGFGGCKNVADHFCDPRHGSVCAIAGFVS